MKKFKTALNFIIFLCIVVLLIVRLSYLFANSGDERERIVGIKEEKQLDVVYIGGSAAINYWDTMKAWNDYGITSYLYATTGIQSENIKAYLIEAQKFSDPKLFIIDARTFIYWLEETDGNEGAIRKGTDSMDVSYNRFAFVHNSLKNHKLTYSDNALEKFSEELSFYLRLLYYHTNYAEVLADKSNWELLDNKEKAKFHGFRLYDGHSFLNKPEQYETEKVRELSEGARKAFIDVLDYCDDKKLDVLFVISPYAAKNEGQEKYNAIETDIINRGYAFLDCNKLYDDIGLDFYTDYLDINHVNVFGAEKYTDYLSRYIMDKYDDLTDHREDNEYEEWKEGYLEYTKELQNAIDEINTSIKYKEQAEQVASQLADCEDLESWLNLANNDNFVMAITGKGEWQRNSTIIEMLSKIGIDTDASKEYLAYIHNGLTDSGYIAENELNTVMRLGNAATNIGQASLITFDSEGNMLIDNQNVAFDDNSINIVVYDKNFNYIIDAVSCSSSESISLKHLKIR